LSDSGEIVQQAWHDLPETYPRVKLDEFVIMPNHVHGILFLQDETSDSPPSVSYRRGGLSVPAQPARAREYAPNRRGGLSVPAQPARELASLSEIIRHFKTTSAKLINREHDTSGYPVWQRGFHEHVIRNEEDLFNARLYIRQNPLKWELDRENPDRM